MRMKRWMGRVCLCMGLLCMVGTAFGHSGQMPVADGVVLTSPNKKVRLITRICAEDGSLSFDVERKTTDGFVKAVAIPTVGWHTEKGRGVGARPVGLEKGRKEAVRYTMLTGKEKECGNEMVEYTYRLEDAKGQPLKLVFRLWNDGVTFRYEFSDLQDDLPAEEQTTYYIPEGVSRWMQKYNISYEDFYPEVTTGKGETRHWGYPALVRSSENVWMLITEADVAAGRSASSLKNDREDAVYRVCPARNTRRVTGDWVSPWRVLIVGGLDEVVESTLVTDVSRPCALEDTTWIQPGCASWVYWAYNRGSKEWLIVKSFIDLAVELNLPYVLIDWQWDVMTGGGDIKDALKYAAERNVKVMLWYNSSTEWTAGGAGGPLYRLNDPAKREKEFAWLQSLGVAGVKIDFFSGDTEETITYQEELLKSAAKHRLLVNFHGATIPRGWNRTYPNLMTVEAVYGAEWYNNKPVLTKKAAAHNATLPFTRNVIGPMDYTPCTFTDSQHPHITSNAHELALCVVFESALQHLADRPSGYLTQPRAVQDFLSTLPSTWDETVLVSGFPADHVVMARRKGSTWYVGALNGTEEDRVLEMDWSFMGKRKGAVCKVRLFEDAMPTPEGTGLAALWRLRNEDLKVKSLPAQIPVKKRGGFVAVIETE